MSKENSGILWTKSKWNKWLERPKSSELKAWPNLFSHPPIKPNREYRGQSSGSKIEGGLRAMAIMASRRIYRK